MESPRVRVRVMVGVGLGLGLYRQTDRHIDRQTDSDKCEIDRIILQVTFNPQDNTQLCVVGNGIFKLYRYSEGNLKQIATQRSETHNYLCQAWASEERVVVGDDDGKIFLFESGDVKAEISIFPKKTTSGRTSMASAADQPVSMTPAPVHCIASSSKGFVCSAGRGVVHLFERVDEKEKEYYRKIREVHVPVGSGDGQSSDGKHVVSASSLEIMNMALSPSEDSLVCSTQGQQLYTIILSTADMGKVWFCVFVCLSVCLSVCQYIYFSNLNYDTIANG